MLQAGKNPEKLEAPQTLRSDLCRKPTGSLSWRCALSLVLLLGLLSTASCGLEPATTDLDGTSWELRSLTGHDLAPGTTITLVFDGGSFYGYGGCNAYGWLAVGDDGSGGQYRVSAGGILSISGVAIAKVDCPAPAGVMEQESAYVKTLKLTTFYRLQGDRLEMLDAGGEVILVFFR